MDVETNDNRLNSSISPKREAFEQECAEYSYAYYEPGPPTSHANFMVSSGSGTRHDRSNRHTYVTRYGTEENIYEEISEVAAKCSQLIEADRRHHQRRSRQNNQSQLSLSQSVVEEEVRRVQSRHRRVLGELNLAVEAMLMPPPSSKDEEPPAELTGTGSGAPDILEDLLMSVGPTDELLSPANCSLGDHDSGFSGSSGTSYGFSGGSGASYNSSVGSGNSLKKQGARSSQSFPRTVGCTGNPGCSVTTYSPLMTRRGGYLKFSKSQEHSPVINSKHKHQPQQQSSSGFFGRKTWIKLPGFGSSKGENHFYQSVLSKTFMYSLFYIFI